MSRGQVDIIRRKIQELPDSPGVYIMKGERGEVIYVGKAKRLSHRVKSYFQRGKLDIKTERLVSKVRDIDYIVTGSEVEALALECNLIKEHKPRYNIRLKDDKRYPYLKLSLKEKFPRLLLVRRIEDDGSEYFGPFTDVKSLRRMLRSIRTIFPLRDCPGRRPGREAGRECLNYFIRRCLAPCTGRIDEREYGEVVEQLRLFLRGKSKRLLKNLEKRMWALSREKRYEEAAFVRDQLSAFRKVLEKQVAASTRTEDFDIVAMSRVKGKACCVVMIVREGKVLGSESFIVPSMGYHSDEEVLESFIKLYYHSVTVVPPAVYIRYNLESSKLLSLWLSEKRGARARVVVPRKGEKRELMELAERNASYRLSVAIDIERAGKDLLPGLKHILGIPILPRRIEAYDISSIQGKFAVGSMVVFQDGIPEKSSYRHFMIRSVDGINDYAMMEEVLERRLKHVRSGNDRAPDLIVVDGGRGQLNAALKVLERMDMGGIAVIGIAKSEELIFKPDSAEPLRLPGNSPALKLIQRLRNEAHRFAVQFHRKTRKRELRVSVLDEIPGIGKRRKTKLLRSFGSVDGLMQATVEDIASVPGIGKILAEKIYEYIHDER